MGMENGEVIGTSLIELILLPKELAELKHESHAIYKTGRVIDILAEKITEAANKRGLTLFKEKLRRSIVNKGFGYDDIKKRLAVAEKNKEGLINRVTKSEPKKESKRGRPEPTSDPPTSWHHVNQ